VIDVTSNSNLQQFKLLPIHGKPLHLAFVQQIETAHKQGNCLLP